MRTAILLLIILTFQCMAMSNDINVQEPELILKGYYRSTDGRVSGHKFPVEIKLLSDGKFTGSYETWLEKIYLNGSKLIYFNTTFNGRWTIENNTMYLTADNGYVLPKFIFGKMNGLQIKIIEK